MGERAANRGHRSAASVRSTTLTAVVMWSTPRTALVGLQLQQLHPLGLLVGRGDHPQVPATSASRMPAESAASSSPQ